MPRATSVAMCLAFLTAPFGPARAQDQQSAPQIRRTTADIARRAAAEGVPLQIEDRELKKIAFDRSSLPQNPESPTVARFGGAEPESRGAATAGPPRMPQTPTLPNFQSVTLDDARALPPDSMGAVGPTNFLTHVNGRVRVHDKGTGVVGALDVTDTVFWPAAVRKAPLGFVGDPRVRFDRLTERWFLTILDIPSNVGASGSRVLLAVSDGAAITPGTVWTFFYFDQDLVSPAGDTGCLADYPTLGVDASALYIGTNVFCGPDSHHLTFSNSSAFVVRKSDLLKAATPSNLLVTSGSVNAFRALIDPSLGGLATPQGVDNYDPAAARGYFIGVNGGTLGKLVLREVNNPGSGMPTLSPNKFLTVPTTSIPIDVAVPGLGPLLDGGDDRLLAAHLRNGTIWTSHQVGVNGSGVATSAADRNGVRWYAIDVNGPTLLQSGTVFDSVNAIPQSYWMGTVMVSGQGHVAMGFTAAAATVAPAAATVGRLASDPPGTMWSPPSRYQPGLADYVDIFSGSPARWGDYSMTTLDPCDDMTMWTIQEFAAKPGQFSFNWGVQVVRLLAPPPGSSFSIVPNTIEVGHSSVPVTIKTSGGAFYDTPNAGMPACRTRIAASVSNGVAVNRLTLMDEHTLILDLNTKEASPSLASLTIRNPDGQTHTAGGGITINPPSGGLVSGEKTISGNLEPGGTLFYTVTLRNFGLPQPNNPGDEFTDVLPTSLALDSASASSGTATIDLPTNTVHWNGSIANHGSVTITIEAKIAAAVPRGTTISNQGTIHYDGGGTGANDAVRLTDDPEIVGDADPTAFVVGAGFYIVTACRVLDTRNPVGAYGGPALLAGADRSFTIGGQCNIPVGARAVSVNLSVTQPTGAGNLRLYPAGSSLPLVSAINYAAGQTRANSAIVPLSALGELAVRCAQAAGTTHFILDVNGYFY